MSGKLIISLGVVRGPEAGMARAAEALGMGRDQEDGGVLHGGLPRGLPDVPVGESLRHLEGRDGGRI